MGMASESTTAMTVCTRVYYSGRVQGVGFRYTALRLAQGRAVTGLVRNLADGRVEMLVEGEQAEVERFLEAVREKMDGYIHAASVQDEPVRGFDDFQIA
jgi:acylphosphatase